MTEVATTIAATPAGIADVAALVDDLAARLGLTKDVVADVQVALDEVLSNIARHGARDGRTPVVSVRLRIDADAVEVEVEDDGRPFNPLSLPSPDLTAPLEERRPGGLGVHFVRRLMTDVGYSFVDNRNRLVLRRRLAEHAAKRGARHSGGSDRGPA